MSNTYMGSIKRNRILGGNQEFTSVCVKFEMFNKYPNENVGEEILFMSEIKGKIKTEDINCSNMHDMWISHKGQEQVIQK